MSSMHGAQPGRCNATFSVKNMKAVNRIRIDSKDGIYPVVCCFVLMLSVSAAFKAQPVFFRAFKDELHLTDEEASWPLTIHMFSVNFSGQFHQILNSNRSPKYSSVIHTCVMLTDLSIS